MNDKFKYMSMDDLEEYGIIRTKEEGKCYICGEPCREIDYALPFRFCSVTCYEKFFSHLEDDKDESTTYRHDTTYRGDFTECAL